jgi:hypothetical protein
VTYPEEIEACFFETGKNFLREPYIWHDLIVFPTRFKAFFDIGGFGTVLSEF